MVKTPLTSIALGLWLCICITPCARVAESSERVGLDPDIPDVPGGVNPSGDAHVV
jgi:hypothetical protein